MASGKTHDFHILPPSPWPIVGALAAMVMLGSSAVWWHGYSWGKWMAAVGLIGVLFTMFAWWSDVRTEANSGDHTPVVQLHHRYGMILFIASEVMFFVAWFWAFFAASLFPHAGEAVGGVWPPTGIEPLDPFVLLRLSPVRRNSVRERGTLPHARSGETATKRLPCQA